MQDDGIRASDQLVGSAPHEGELCPVCGADLIMEQTARGKFIRHAKPTPCPVGPERIEHFAIKCAVRDAARALGCIADIEVDVRQQKRADVMITIPDGHLIIVEVAASDPDAFRAQQRTAAYKRYGAIVVPWLSTPGAWPGLRHRKTHEAVVDPSPPHMVRGAWEFTGHMWRPVEMTLAEFIGAVCGGLRHFEITDYFGWGDQRRQVWTTYADVDAAERRHARLTGQPMQTALPVHGVRSLRQWRRERR